MKTPNTLYSRLALVTSVTLVVGYFVVYAMYESISAPEIAPSAPLTSVLMTKIKTNLDDLDTRVTNLTATVVASSIWSKVGNDINYTAGKVGIGTTSPNKSLHIQTPTGTNAELDIQSGTKPLWGIYHDETTEELRFWNGANRVVIGSTGNVGIGVNPTEKLEVSGNIKATSFYGIGTNLTALNGTQITTGTVPVARLGSGTPSSSTYLRGDGTWTTVSAGSDCIGVAVGTACGGGKYAGGGLVAMTADESTTPAWATALTICLGKATGGFTDWRLPTIDELRILYINKSTIGGFINTLYSSSTEYNSTNYDLINLQDGSLTNTVKTNAYYNVRCVRKF